MPAYNTSITLIPQVNTASTDCTEQAQKSTRNMEHWCVKNWFQARQCSGSSSRKISRRSLRARPVNTQRGAATWPWWSTERIDRTFIAQGVYYPRKYSYLCYSPLSWETYSFRAIKIYYNIISFLEMALSGGNWERSCRRISATQKLW